MNIVRVLLSIAINLNWNLYQLNVKNAFLQEDLEEEVYMSIPEGHPYDGKGNLVCKLNKTIYGLKQSPQAWYARLSIALLKIDFCI